MGAALDLKTMTIHQRDEVTTCFMTVPYNHVRKALQNHFVRARSRAAYGRRALNEGLAEVDTEAYKLAFAKLPIESRKIVAYLSSGGALPND